MKSIPIANVLFVKEDKGQENVIKFGLGMKINVWDYTKGVTAQHSVCMKKLYNTYLLCGVCQFFSYIRFMFADGIAQRDKQDNTK